MDTFHIYVKQNSFRHTSEGRRNLSSISELLRNIHNTIVWENTILQVESYKKSICLNNILSKNGNNDYVYFVHQKVSSPKHMENKDFFSTQPPFIQTVFQNIIFICDKQLKRWDCHFCLLIWGPIKQALLLELYSRILGHYSERN